MAEEASHLTVNESDGVHVVEFTDRRITEELVIADIGDALSSLITANPSIKLLLTFRQVQHLSSAALGMLIKLHKEVGEGGGRLKLSDISPQIFEVFKITRLNKLFDIHPTRDKALAGF